MGVFATFTFFDWGVLAILLLLAVGGVLRGFTREAIGLAGWVLAVVVVRLFHHQATLWLAPKTGGETSAAILSFIVLFFGTAFVARLAAGLVSGSVHHGMLGPLDRILGLGFGTLKGLILASALFLLAQFASGVLDGNRPPPDWLLRSRSAPLLALTSEAMVGWLHEVRRGDGATGRWGTGLPPGHPGAPSYRNRNEPGYSRQDRDKLDRLLEEGAKNGEQVDI